jgi:hypothetical protein
MAKAAAFIGAAEETKLLPPRIAAGTIVVV